MAEFLYLGNATVGMVPREFMGQAVCQFNFSNLPPGWREVSRLTTSLGPSHSFLPTLNTFLVLDPYMLLLALLL